MRRLLGLGLLALLLGGCAWSNRANRPVWNAFEQHLVPEGDGAFYAALPLTVPAGLLAILADTFVVHPAQVADDAWGDAADLWDGVPWAGEYYSQMALLPFRVVGTPLLFVVAFLGRSCFDLPPHGEQPAPDEAQAAREAQLLAAFGRVAGGATRDADIGLEALPPPPWSDALQAGYAQALAGASAPGRLALLLYVRRHDLPPARSDAALGLRDPDPVVRHELLRTLLRPERVPADVRAALRDDPNEMVRALARDLWP